VTGDRGPETEKTGDRRRETETGDGGAETGDRGWTALQIPTAACIPAGRRLCGSGLHFGSAHSGLRKFNLRSQLERAATSIVLNIAEGSTSQTDAEQRRFLGLPLRSYIETIACFDLLQRRRLLNPFEAVPSRAIGSSVACEVTGDATLLEGARVISLSSVFGQRSPVFTGLPSSVLGR